ncbi:hypothetical protein CRV08_04710 [Halarcobacter ebronensis]|uniref:Uncharacterized protein n=1 Tax=Halarcobacter ebronensis TaxID=1462615 RepID=A0A4Q0YHT3_9BACT|nr:hypothetical protein [Halarcobacter ebronensis]RXJ69314.1 hypothetical protein CRV08_04710 [Halarcobacter ebronensis]
MNRDIYGITIASSRNDRSLNPVEQLNPNEYKKFNNKLYSMILEYLDLKNDFQYDAKYIRGSKSNIAETLVNHFYRLYVYQYQGKTDEECVLQLFNDKEYTERLEKIYLLYKEYSNKYLKYSNRKLNFFDYKYTMVRITARIYYMKQFRTNKNLFTKKECEDIKVKDFLENLIKLSSYKKDSHRDINKFIFAKGSIPFFTLKMLEVNCTNQKEEVKEALKYF